MVSKFAGTNIVNIGKGTVDDILTVVTQIPEFDRGITKDKLNSRLSGTPHLILIARIDDRAAGYKVGYEISGDEFYSWLGGVVPEYRNNGIATVLREYQESWAIESGYKTISVKSMNRFPGMLQLLISSKYKIIGYEEGETKCDGKIVFSKELSR